MKRLIDSLKPGSRVFVPSLSNESALLQSELVADPAAAVSVTFCGIQFPGLDSADYLAVHPEARLEAFFMSPSVRRGLAENRAQLFGIDYLGIANRLQTGNAFDVAVAQLSTPDENGWCSAGLSADFTPLVWKRAKLRAAHLNPNMPRTRGSFRVHMSEIDVPIEADLPIRTFDDATVGEVETRIGSYVASIVRDNDTIQFGVGAIPSACAFALTGHKRLRFHGGMLPGAILKLWNRGAIDRDHQMVAGVVLGDKGLHEFVGTSDAVYLTDVTQTHSITSIASIPQFVAINSAVEVDLFGQVNSERAGGAIQAGAGGLPAFVQGALLSPKGRSLICLPSTAKKGAVSRIVPVLDGDAFCTIPRHHADVVVTEYGSAHLRGLSLEARAQALISIAAPEHQAKLSECWNRIRSRV